MLSVPRRVLLDVEEVIDLSAHEQAPLVMDGIMDLKDKSPLRPGSLLSYAISALWHVRVDLILRQRNDWV